MKRSTFDDQRDPSDHAPTYKRANYHCKAHGCPNTGSMDGDLCYWHKQADPLAWGNVTMQINNNFEQMRNFGPPMQKTEADVVRLAQISGQPADQIRARLGVRSANR